MKKKEQALSKPCPLVTRRQFLAGLGATVAVAACSGRQVTVFEPSTTGTALPPGTALPAVPKPGTFPLVPNRTLVVIELGGGNDSLSMVVPHGTSRYYDLRKSTAIDAPIDLDGSIGLHPNLGSIAGLYSKGQVAIVEGIGMPDPDLSHFLSMQRWWAGDPDGAATGWLGRYLDGTVGYEELLAGITIGYGPSQAMLGGGSFVVNIADAYGLQAQVPWWVDNHEEFLGAWAGFAPVGVPLDELTPLQRAISSTVEAQRRLQAELAPLQAAMESGDDEEESGFADHLRLAASLIVSGAQPRVIYVHGHGDFDTHENQRDTHDQIMADLDRAVAVFFETLAAGNAADRAVLMTTSEFGRRPEDNDGGTDHGTAATHLLIGSPVAGGRYGEPASFTKLDRDDNFIHTVDYRSMFATVLDGWLGVEHPEILNGSFEALPVFSEVVAASS